MKTIEKCPVCSETLFSPFLSCVDHMITKEKFNIVSCNNCRFHFTNPVPTVDMIGEYYKSDNYVSHSSSKKGFVNFLYGIVRTFTLKQKLRWVKNNTLGKELLDIGSGTGHFLKAARKKGFHGLGIEPDNEARTYAHRVNHVRSYSQKELYKIKENTFDAITLWHVLEHVYHLNKDIKQIKNLLKPTGTLFVAVPNMASYDASYYKSFWAAYDVPRHLYHFQQYDIARLFANHGFELKKVIPMKYDAFYVSMLSEKYKKGFFLKGVWIGLLSNFKAKKHGYSSQVYVLKHK